MVANDLSQPAEYQDSWLSYCAATAGALTALGRPCDVADAAGYSGLAFLVNVTEGWTDPGSPTLHSGNVARTGDGIVALWQDFSRRLEVLGARVEHYWDPQQYHFWKAIPGEQLARARRLYERVCASIDAGRPVVVWGLVVPEYGLVNGYDTEHYHVSTFRRQAGQPEDPVRWDTLQVKGGLEAVFFEKATPAANPDHRALLTRALVLAQGEVGPFAFETPGHPIRTSQRYVAGPAAYDEWARTLEARVPGTLFYEYNSYNAACLHAAKQAEASFLARLAERYRAQPQAEALAEAARAFGLAEGEVRALTEMCPYADSGDLSPAQCRHGAERLRAARPFEEAGIAALRAAVAAWA